MASPAKTLHWTQRIALVRHNLHAASRSGDFTFFKALQARSFIDGINHAAGLSAALGDEADGLISTLNDLNSSLAQVHEDAFKNVYDSIKSYITLENTAEKSEQWSKIFVDSSMQRQIADMAIDKMTSSAISMTQQQPAAVQCTAASAWINGVTIIADTIEICLQQLNALETKTGDFIRLEDSWATVKASVGCSVAALRGIYTMMDIDEHQGSEPAASRRTSLASSTGNVFRRVSNAFLPASPTKSSSVGGSERKESTVIEYKTPSYLRRSISEACPTSLPDKATPIFFHTDLSPIAPTPRILDEEINPFDNSTAPPMPIMPVRLAAPVMTF